MRSLLLIMRREVLERVHTRSFRLFTFGLFIMVMGALIAIDRAPAIFGEEDVSLGVPAGAPPGLTAAIERFADLEDRDVHLVTYASPDAAQTLLDSGEIDAFLSDGSLTYSEDEITSLTTVVSNAVFSYELAERLEELGVSREQMQELLSPEPVEVVIQNGEPSDSGERQFIGFIAALALYATIAVYGNWILTGIVEEKSSRVVEVLLGLVRPHEMLAGKTLGILVVAISQLLVALAGAAIAMIISGTDQLPAVALDVVLVGVPLFILGLLLYSLLYASVGATVSRQADAQSAATPIVMLLLVPYMFSAIFVPQNPDGAAATFLSLFPFTSPLVMPARVATGSPSAPELALCFALLVPVIALVALIGGRIYAGVILSGRRLDVSTLVSLIARPSETP